MGMGMAGFGRFAGGVAGGMYTGHVINRDMQRERREEEEYQNLQGWRREAGNTIGNVGQAREDGSIYGEDQAYQDLSRLGAQYNPEKAMQARATGLQVKQAKRTDQQNSLADTYMQLQRRLATGEDPMSVFREASQAYAQINDGKQVTMSEDASGTPMIALTDVTNGKTSLVPFSAESVNAVVRNLYALSSPQAFQQAHERGLADRKAGQTDRQLGLLERRIDQQGELMEAQGEAYRALAGQREQTGSIKMPEGDRIFLTRLGQNEQALMANLSKLDPLDPSAQQTRTSINQQLLRVKKAQYDMLMKHKVLPEGTSRTAFLGLPDPLMVARANMTQFAQSEEQFRMSLDAFDEMYGDAPEASQARNALAVFMQNQFYSRVKPQNAGVVGPVIRGLAPGNLANTMTEGAVAAEKSGLNLFGRGQGGYRPMSFQ